LGFWILVGLSLGYGLEFMLGFWLFLFGVLPFEKGAIALVGYWSATRIILSVKVKVLGVAFVLMVGRQYFYIVYGKMSTSLSF
jgi:hypothetical protein